MKKRSKYSLVDLAQDAANGTLAARMSREPKRIHIAPELAWSLEFAVNDPKLQEAQDFIEANRAAHYEEKAKQQLGD